MKKSLNLAALFQKKSFRIVVGVVFVVAFLVIVGSLVSIGKQLCKNAFAGGAVLVHADTVASGYTLLPIYRAEDKNSAGEVRLINNNGVVVHAWATELSPFMAYLQPNGDLYTSLSRPLPEKPSNPVAGTTGVIERLNWQGEVLWKYEDPAMNHDFDVLPNGNIAYTRWEVAPAAFHYAVHGPATPSSATATWTNGIVVVDVEKKIIWQWHLYDHVSPQDFEVDSLSQKSDWSHINSIRYVADNPLTHTPAYLISARNISTVFLIDAASGRVIWHSPKGTFTVQHDAQLLPSGNILVFDNAFGNPLAGFLPVSAAKEIDPRTNKLDWSSKVKQPFYEQLLSNSVIQGGAERLANENTLITLTMENRIIEVNKKGQTVWEYVNGYRNEEGISHTVFKARKYDPAGTAWKRWPPLKTLLVDAVCE